MNKKGFNKVIYCGDYSKIVLYDIHKKITGYALVDNNDIKKIDSYRWHLNAQGYVLTRIGYRGKFIRLHHLIIGRKKGYEVDHINRNKLDNRKSNLRFVTRTENNLNQGINIRNKSGYKGVSWDKERKKWLAQLRINKVNVYFKRFNLKTDAINARKNAELRYFN